MQDQYTSVSSCVYTVRCHKTVTAVTESYLKLLESYLSKSAQVLDTVGLMAESYYQLSF
jgi:hypothetical protein